MPRRALLLFVSLAACHAEAPATSSAGAAAQATLRGAHVASSAADGRPSFLWSTGHAAATSDDPEAAALAHLARLAPRYGLDPAAIAQAELRSVHGVGDAVIVQLFARHQGLEVLPSEVRVLMRADLSLVAVTGALPARTAPAKADRWNLGPDAALALAAHHTLGREVEASEVAPIAPIAQTDEATFFVASGPSQLVLPTPARTRKVLFVQGGLPKLAYLVEGYFGALDTNDAQARRFVIAAKDGAVLQTRDLTADAEFTYRVWAENTGDLRPLDGPVADFSPHPTGTPDDTVPAWVPGNLVTVEGFNTNPSGAGDPWLSSTADLTTGNNVDAYADHYAPDGYSRGDLRAETTGPQTFDYSYDTTRGPADNQTQIMGSVTQLFFDINWLHDYWYDSGFDEAAGNAQLNNFGRGGEAGDAMRAEAQDSYLSGSRNNANMSTPSDGLPPRMQIYAWSGRADVGVDALGQRFAAGTAAFGPGSFDVSGTLVAALDGVSVSEDGCEPITNNIAGQIAIVDRGACTFAQKAENVQAAGGIGMVLANNRAGSPPAMGGSSGIVTIPLLSVSQTDGATLRAALGGGPVQLTLHRALVPDLDGSLDSNLVAHEWGHYLHHRLADCGAVQCRGMSEGWADFLGMHTQSRPGDDLHGAFAAAGYASLGRVNGSFFGVRRYAYSVDRAINDLSFRHIADGEPVPTNTPTDPSSSPNSEVHNTGEIWATMLWEAYVALQDAAAASGNRTFEDVRRVMSQYIVGSMMITPDNGTFTESRDAMLAVALASDPADYDVIAQAFARRGAGTCATSPNRDTDDNVPVTEDTALRPQIALEASALEVTGFSCDEDGVLDRDERGQVHVQVMNAGHVALTGAQVVLTSSTGAFVFGGTGVAALPNIPPLGTAQVSLDVALAAGFAGPATPGFSIRLEAPDGCETVVTSTVYVPVDRDEPTDSTFDDVQAENTSWATGGEEAPRVWARTEVDPGQRVWRGIDDSTYSDTWLETPALHVGTSTSFVFSARHRYRFEANAPDGTDVNWDGAVVELSTDDGATWEDVSAYVDPGYRGTLTDSSGNPLADRAALVGTSPSWPDFAPLSLDFGSTFAGQTVRLRVRIGTDAAVGEYGIELDDIEVRGTDNAPFVRISPDGTTCPAELVAAAGPDQAVGPLETVVLDGAGSSSFHGRPLSFSWRQTSGDAVSLTPAGEASVAFTAPSALTERTFEFELTVRDGVLQATDTVAVVVAAAPAAPLSADAGDDQSVAAGAEVVLDGSRSVVPAGGQYTWTQTDGPEVTLGGADGPVARFTAPALEAQATLTFTLTVDGEGRTDADTVVITVDALGAVVADAGGDQSVAAGATVTLDGRASRGPAGLGFAWKQLSGPSVQLAPDDAEIAVFEAPSSSTAQVVEIELRVFDGGRESTDTVRIDVAAAPVETIPEGDGGCRCVAPGERPLGFGGLGALLLGLAGLVRRRRR